MIALAVIVAVVGLLLLLRVGAEVEFSDAGLEASARIGFVKIAILPKKERGKTLETEKKPKKKREKSDKREKAEQKKLGDAYEFRELLSGAVKLLNSLRRRLLIKRISVVYVQGGGDAFTMAMTHGGIGAAFGLTQAVFETAFRVKSYSLQTSVDYLADGAKIYAEAAISIAVWEVISLGISAIILFIKAKKPIQKQPAVTAGKRRSANG